MSLIDTPHTVDVHRLAAVVGTTKRRDTVVAAGVPCFIQPMDPRAAATYGMAIGTGFMMFANDSNGIRSGDQVVYAGQEYGVQGVQYFNYGDPHYEIALTKEVK